MATPLERHRRQRDINNDVTVLLTRALQRDGLDANLDKELRRALIHALGFATCDQLDYVPDGYCDCDEVEPMFPTDLCTSMWAGCNGCNENWLTNARIGEYDHCRACHADRRCLDDDYGCGRFGDCTVFPLDA